VHCGIFGLTLGRKIDSRHCSTLHCFPGFTKFRALRAPPLSFTVCLLPSQIDRLSCCPLYFLCHMQHTHTQRAVNDLQQLAITSPLPWPHLETQTCVTHRSAAQPQPHSCTPSHRPTPDQPHQSASTRVQHKLQRCASSLFTTHPTVGINYCNRD